VTDPKKLIAVLQNEFGNNPLVTAFVLVGSQARTDVYKATANSDMEAYVIAADENADKLESQLPQISKKTGTVLFSFKHAIGFVAVYEDLFRLELPVIKESGLPGLFNRPKSQVVKVLIDKTDGNLEKILSSRPDTLDFAKEFSNKVTNFWFWQILAVQYFLKGEMYNTQGVLRIQSSSLVWFYELLNDPQILLLETNKRVEKFLTRDQLKNIQAISPPYDRVSIAVSLSKVIDIFPGVFSQITNKYGYEFDTSLEPKIKPKLLKLLSGRF
jgi:hypothetical protein